MFQYLEHVKKIEQDEAGAIVDAVLARLAEVDVSASWQPRETISSRFASGALLLQVGAQGHEVPAIAGPAVSTTDLALLPHGPSTVLLTPTVSDARASALRKEGWGGFVDTAGNASLRVAGHVIEIRGKRGAAPGRAPIAAPFTRTGIPVTFALLLGHAGGCRMTQRELAERSGASLGTVNRVVRALRGRTPSMLDPKNGLLRPDDLEDEWVAAYAAAQASAWPEERFSSALWGAPSDLLDVELPSGALFGSELAAAQLGAPLRPSQALVHLPQAGRSQFIRQGRLRASAEGFVRVRPAIWASLPDGTGAVAPRPLLRADLRLEDDPRIDEVRARLFGGRG